MTIGAGYKLAVNSATDLYITLPYFPVDGNEDVTFYDNCTVYCISGPNQGTSRAVALNGYDKTTKRLTVATPWSNAPQAGEVYVISASVKENQLQGESGSDENGSSIANPKKPIDYKQIHTTPLLNEVEYRAERVESE